MEELVEPIIEEEEEIQQEEAEMLSVIDQLEARHAMTNIADELDEETIHTLAARVVEDYKTDKDSRSEWETTNNEILNIARLAIQKKTYAGEPVANVKYPVITNAAISFGARVWSFLVF